MSEQSGQGSGSGVGPFTAVIVILGLLAAVLYITVAPVMNCVAAGTLIDTPDGPRAIELLQRGDRVLTHSPDGKIEPGRVVDTLKHSANQSLKFKFSNGSVLRVTSEHPLAARGEWKRAGSVTVGEEIIVRSGTAKVESIQTLRGTIDVYDLTVSPNENFFAGGVLVHNKRSRQAANETATAAACKAYAEAQEIYHRTDYDGDSVLEYALAASGKFSLLEKEPGAKEPGIIDKAFAAAFDTTEKASPKAGYYFKILTAQGANANGGKKSYLDEKGNLTGGYAVVAWPATWDTTGRNTFIINNSGTIYQSDLGENSAARAKAMTEYDPDPKIWVPAE